MAYADDEVVFSTAVSEAAEHALLTFHDSSIRATGLDTPADLMVMMAAMLWLEVEIPSDDSYVEDAGKTYKLGCLADFRAFREAALDDAGFAMKHQSNGVTILAQPRFHLHSGDGKVKVIAEFPNVTAETLYDALHDHDFRATWDSNKISSETIGSLGPRDDICCYAFACPWPLASRDFVTQRRWMEFTTGEFVIMNSSVDHVNGGPKRGLIRAQSHLTGWYVAPDSTTGGCRLVYYTEVNLQGNIPQSLVTLSFQKNVPKAAEALRRAAEGYTSWRRERHPTEVVPPWRTPRLSWDADVSCGRSRLSKGVVVRRTAPATAVVARPAMVLLVPPPPVVAEETPPPPRVEAKRRCLVM